jgi:hypothetical protein
MSSSSDEYAAEVIELLTNRLKTETDFDPKTALPYFEKWLDGEGNDAIRFTLEKLYDAAASDGFQEGVEQGRYSERVEMMKQEEREELQRREQEIGGVVGKEETKPTRRQRQSIPKEKVQ